MTNSINSSSLMSGAAKELETQKNKVNEAYDKMYSSKQNPHVVKLGSDTSSDTESAQKRLDDSKQHFLSMLMTELRLQDPTDPIETKEITQLTSQLTLVQQSIDSNQKLGQILDALRKSDLDKAKEYLGQEVYYDVGKQGFYGTPVEYEYLVEFTADYSDNNRYQLKSNIQILDKNGQSVFETVRMSNVNKANTFVWDGKEIDRMTRKTKYAPNGDYRIKVDAEIIDRATTNLNAYPSQGIKVSSSTSRSGVVTEIVNQKGKSFLLVNNTLVNPNDIIKLTDKKENNQVKETKYQNCLNYIGKKVVIEAKTLNIKTGFADIEFDNKIANYGGVLVKVRDQKGDFVALATLDKSQVRLGKNSYTWNCIKASTTEALNNYNKFKDDKSAEIRAQYRLDKLPDGKYTYEVQIENFSSPNEFNKFEKNISKVEGTVSSVRRLDDDIKITVNGKEYSIDEVSKFEEAALVGTNDLYTKVSSMIGKTVVYDNNLITLNHNAPSLDFNLAQPFQGSRYLGAELKIFDLKGSLVETLRMSDKELFYDGELSPPPYNALDDDSIKEVNNQIITKLGNLANYANISSAHRIEVDNKVKEFDLNASYETLSPEQKQTIDQFIKDKAFQPYLTYQALDKKSHNLVGVIVREKYGTMNYNDLQNNEKKAADEFIKNISPNNFNELTPLEKDNVNKFVNRTFATNVTYEGLSDEEKAPINNIIQERFTNQHSYIFLNEGQKKEIDTFIKEKFYDGKLHDEEYSKLTVEEKTLNLKKRKGNNTFVWNGLKNSATGVKFDNGLYKYDLSVTHGKTVKKNGKDVVESSANKITVRNNEGVVAQIKVNNGDYIFVIEDENAKTTEIKEERIITIKQTPPPPQHAVMPTNNHVEKVQVPVTATATVNTQIPKEVIPNNNNFADTMV